MEARAYLKYARISPRKVQYVLDLIRGKDVAVAMGILQNKPRAASELLIKLLGSAIANAENNFHMDTSLNYNGINSLVYTHIINRRAPLFKTFFGELFSENFLNRHARW